MSALGVRIRREATKDAVEQRLNILPARHMMGMWSVNTNNFRARKLKKKSNFVGNGEATENLRYQKGVRHPEGQETVHDC